MSYILDALRRADAERQRGQVPGLGAQPAAVSADTEGSRRVPGWALLAGALLAVGALALLVMWRTQPGAAPTAAAPAIALPVPAAPPLPVVVSAPPPVVHAALSAASASAAARTAPALATAPMPAASRAEPPPTPLAALTPDQRRELPPLVLGGSIWSDNVAQRFVIINGQIAHEGESAAPGVVVERITARSAIVRWRELRIELSL